MSQDILTAQVTEREDDDRQLLAQQEERDDEEVSGELFPAHRDMGKSNGDFELQDLGEHNQESAESIHYARSSNWAPSGLPWTKDRAWRGLRTSTMRLRSCWDKYNAGDVGDEVVTPFYAVDSTPPWGLTIFMGLQHAMAMAAGIVSIPIIISSADAFRLPTPDTQYLISVGLILSGVSSLIQVRRFALPRGKFLGTGMISISGTSFTFVPIAQAASRLIMQQDGTYSCIIDADCTHAWSGADGSSIPGISNIGQCNTATNKCRRDGTDALGAFLGTSMLCCMLQILLSFAPPKQLRRLFPPAVTGVCVTLIGTGLSGTAFKYWGGGPVCAFSAAPHTAVVHKGSDLASGTLREGALSYASHSPCRTSSSSSSGGGGVLTKVEMEEGRWHGCGGNGGRFIDTCRYKFPYLDAPANMTRGDITECLVVASHGTNAPRAVNPASAQLSDVALQEQRVQLGVRVDFLVSRMRESGVCVWVCV